MSFRAKNFFATTKRLFDSVSKLETVKADVVEDKEPKNVDDGHPLYENLTARGERYSNEKFIAAGGEKAVFSVYDQYSCRDVALARPIFHRFEREKEQFIKEALICAKLQHPNIVPVYDVGVDCADIPYFTMKLFVGDTLKDIIFKLRNEDAEYQKDYDLNRLLIIFIKICDAIEYAHLHNVIHCDIKPENIHIDKFGSVLIGDWGLSKIIPTNDKCYNKESSLLDLEVNVINANPEPGSIRGTPGYLAPEILHGIHSGDTRSDIYSLGALLFELLSYEKPVSGNTPQELFENTKKHKIRDLEIKANWKRSPQAIKKIILKAISLNPKDRYSSVQELRSEVTNYLHGFATASEKSSQLTVIRLMLHRNKVIVGLVAGFTILISMILISSYDQINKEKAEAEIRRDIAEKNLILYKEMDKRARLLNDNLSKLVQNSKYISRESIKYRILAHGYATNFEKDPTKKMLLNTEKAFLHYIMQEFNKAVQCMKDIEEDSSYIEFYKECQRLAEIKPNDQELLSPEQLSQLLDSPFDSGLATKLFYLHVSKSTNLHPNQMLEPVRKILNIINNTDANNFSVSLETVEEGSVVDLSYAPYTDFILPIETQKPFNVLSVLKPVSINFRHSWFNDLSKLRGLRVKKLNLTDTNIHKERFWFWINRLKIQEITIFESQFPEKEIVDNKDLVKINFEAQ